MRWPALGSCSSGTVLPGPVLSHWAVLWTAVFILLNGLFDGQTELLRGAGRPWLEAALQIVAGVAQLALGVAVVLGGYGLAALMAVLAIKQLFAVGLAQVWLPVPWGRGSGLWRAFLRRGLWLGAATTLAVIAGRAAQLALGNLGSSNQVAQFAVASRYLELATMVCGTAAFGLLPAMAQRARHAGASGPSFQLRLVALTLIASVVLAGVSTPLVPWLTVTVFGSRYRGAVPASQLFVAFLPVVALTNIAWYALVAERLRASRRARGARRRRRRDCGDRVDCARPEPRGGGRSHDGRPRRERGTRTRLPRASAAVAHGRARRRPGRRELMSEPRVRCVLLAWHRFEWLCEACLHCPGLEVAALEPTRLGLPEAPNPFGLAPVERADVALVSTAWYQWLAVRHPERVDEVFRALERSVGTIVGIESNDELQLVLPPAGLERMACLIKGAGLVSRPRALQLRGRTALPGSALDGAPAPARVTV